MPLCAISPARTVIERASFVLEPNPALPGVSESPSLLVAGDRDVPKVRTQVVRGDRMAGFMDGDVRKTTVVHR